MWKKLQISDSQAEAQRDGVRIPMTESEYCLKPRATSDHDLDFDMDDDDDEDFYDDDDECCYESSGQFTLLLKKVINETWTKILLSKLQLLSLVTTKDTTKVGH